jgi:hypothetical protein
MVRIFKLAEIAFATNTFELTFTFATLAVNVLPDIWMLLLLKIPTLLFNVKLLLEISKTLDAITNMFAFTNATFEIKLKLLFVIWVFPE